MREQILGDRPQRGTRQILNLDPPDHTRLRRLVQQVFTPADGRAAGAAGAGDGRRDARRRGGAAPGRRARVDVIADLAFPLPFRVITEMLGMPVSEEAQLRDLGAHAHARARAAARAAAPRGDPRRVRPHRRARARRHRVEARPSGRRPALGADRRRGRRRPPLPRGAPRPGDPPLHRRARDDRQPHRQRHATRCSATARSSNGGATTRRSTPTRSTSCCATTARCSSRAASPRRRSSVGDQTIEPGVFVLTCLAAANRDPAQVGRRRPGARRDAAGRGPAPGVRVGDPPLPGRVAGPARGPASPSAR